MKSLEGDVAIVTGGARAIGQEIALTLAARGARIVSFDLGDSSETVAKIEEQGGEALGLVCDVTDEESIAAAMGEVLTRYGRVDILVNNAGVFSTMERGPFWEINPDDWDLMMKVNAKSVFLVSKHVTEAMREAKSGRVVNIASNVFSFGMPNFMHYVASKGAVVGISRAMARELGPFGVAVNAVSPGLVTTEITKATISEEYLEQIAQGQCLTTQIFPSDIANAVAFLAGPEARMITGQTLMVNGGATIGPS